MDILEEIKKEEKYLINTRRKLHQNPELSSNEFKTQKFIINELNKMGIQNKKVGNTSVLAVIEGNKKGKTVMLRADIDALPILEKSEIDYKSKIDGIMHACGHDAHTAILLGAANFLIKHKDLINGTIKLIFQEAEETFSGAKSVIKEGILKGVDAIFGLHGMPLNTGYYDLHSGYRMAGCDTIYVNFEGISGHGSSPHLAKDTIRPAAQFVIEMENIVTKFIDAQDSVVLSVGKFVGGTKANIISKYTNLDISMRYFNKETRKKVHDLIIKKAKMIEMGYDIKVSVKIEESALSLYNNEEITKIAQKSAEKIFGKNKNIENKRLMGSEDMSYYFEKIKGCYANVGYYNENKNAVYFPHHERFNIDEDYMSYASALHVQFALDFLNN